MIYDCFTYNGELDILKIRLNCLSDYVDKFIIVEAKTTFSGYKKRLYFTDHEQYLRKFWHKIDYFIINERYSEEEIQLAEHSPNTRGASHWTREFLQKESIKKALKDLKNDDRVYIGDVDEIWEPYEGKYPAKLKLHVYAYYLNNLSSEEFWGTLVAYWGDIKYECLNHLRTEVRFRTEKYYGCHFTSMGGVKEVSRKLNDSYTPESYNTYEVQQMLPQRIRKGTDYLGRNFTFQRDMYYWPLYLKENKGLYKHLLK